VGGWVGKAEPERFRGDWLKSEGCPGSMLIKEAEVFETRRAGSPAEPRLP